ncbi:multi-sensor signal transduction histidine kinase [Stanieria cyanosphaera PCC 7437]|uniref:histidine kinase n=1 Tax=Stanieria cyanosphaera (strain ATCC 29371 / PCC 7437) TaxID=111780 RepID=K9XYC5_STAC7|nr:sensor histidine kinase [Stanieria cyanosphaera]AFZ37111.1 multi-sensor signal transduction histidine kinase [Stanieria cyanosphaera PCC 7437]
MPKLPAVYRGALILAIPLLSVIITVYGWMWSRQEEAKAHWWVNHTEEVMRESNVLLRLLLDAETGVRGYKITQDEDFLKPYQQSLQEIPSRLNSLKQLTEDNPLQKQHLQAIEPQVQQRLNVLARILQRMEIEQQTTLSPQLRQLFEESQQEMNIVRNLLNAFQKEEWRLLNSRRDNLEQVRNVTNILLVSTITISLISYFVAVQFYRNSEGKLEEQAKELVLVNTSLAETNANLTSRNQELDQFTYIVSHDLKAPLRAIANLSEWLEEDLQDKLDEDTSHQLTLLRQRVFRMDAFIDGLLRYSRAGRLKEEKTIVDVKELLAEIIDSLNPPPEFTIKINGAMPVFKTEVLPLQQVLSNLISNGIKYNSNPEGKIEIFVSDRDSAYQFAIADNGMGIPVRYHEKIFEIFQTLASREEKESTGIGLSIVKKIVENQGGKIWLESQEGQGTTFYFTWLK